MLQTYCPVRDVAQEQGVAVLDRSRGTAGDLVADAHAFGHQDVLFPAAVELDARDRRVARRVVLDIDDTADEVLVILADVLQLGFIFVGW